MEELHRYVRESLLLGASRENIRTELRKGKWRKEDIDAALAAYVDGTMASYGTLPVPVRKPQLSAYEALQYLLLFLCLCICAFATGNLAFNALDAWVPDPARPYETWSSSSAHLALAALIVSTPIYIGLSRAVAKAIAIDPVKRESGVRKWTSYLMLFITGATAIGDLISILYNFFEGNFPLNAALKLFVVLLIAGGIFVYYLGDLRRDDATPEAKSP